MPRRYSDFPDTFLLWNVVARVGSVISVVSVMYFLFILWEAFASHRPALSAVHRSTALEMYHSFPPADHSYVSIPIVTKAG